MSKTKHTPGPWKEEINHVGQLFVKTSDPCHLYFIGDLEDTCSECHANARLIAAAPDLLAACEDIKKYLDFISSGQPTHGTVERELYYKLQAAIAAAHSES